MIVDLDRPVRWLRRWAWHDVAVRGAMLATALGALGVTAAASTGPVRGQVVALVVATALVAAARPDTNAPAATIIAVVWVWLRLVDEDVTGWTFLVAVLLLCFHTAGALAALAPLGAEPDRRSLIRWGRRVAMVAAAIAAVTVVAASLQHRGPAGNAGLLGAALIAGAGAASVLVRLGSRPVSRPGSRRRR